MRSCFLTALAMLALVAPVRADLPGYVAKADASFRWELKGKVDSPLGTIYDLHLSSQTWQGIAWEHGLQVHVPLGVTPTATMFLWNQGGKPSTASAAFGLALAAKINAPVAFLFGIPNQPLLDGKREDALIAETFVRYLETKDEDWPLLFPMVKSLVRAMDVLQAFTLKEWKQPTTGFVVAGASKRGWTTWLTAAIDHRVTAIVPLVIDTLNMPEQLPHQLKSFGRYSEQIADYTARGLVPLPDGDAARKLWRMTDPFSYRESLNLPKFIINGANDPYWTIDALNFYWDGLKGDKWVCYVPNAGHNLEQRSADAKVDRSWAVDSLAAFGWSQVHGQPLPRMKWKHDEVEGRFRATVDCSAPPAAARVWVADAPTRDFRKEKWVERSAETAGNKVVGTIDRPASGFRAFFVEVDYVVGGLSCRFSTQVRVIGD
jgi:PhoPQ-activated pathogenicity-related protein